MHSLIETINRFLMTSGRLSSQDDLDDDSSSLYSPSVSGAAGKPDLDTHDHSKID